jgi:hypothetical protein
LKSDGTVIGWGWNAFQQSTIPAGLSNVTGIAGGGFHSLALKADGTVNAWGRNNYQQTATPPGLTGVTRLAAGMNHALVLAPVSSPTISTVTVTGTRIVGQALTATATATATGMPTPALTYQWQRSADSGSSWTNIDSATASTYTLTNTDGGKQVRVRATATNGVSPQGTVVSTASTVQFPTPTITTVTPATGPETGGGTLTITGTGFRAGATVTLGGKPCTTPAVTATEITCTIPPGTGTRTLTVTNPDTQTATRNDAYTYIPAPVDKDPAPVVAACTLKVGKSLVVKKTRAGKRVMLVKLLTAGPGCTPKVTATVTPRKAAKVRTAKTGKITTKPRCKGTIRISIQALPAGGTNTPSTVWTRTWKIR